MAEAWKGWLKDHPDKIYVDTLVNIITRGAKIGYCGPDQLLLNKPHLSAAEAPEVLSADLQKQQQHHRLIRLPYPPQRSYVSSPLGLVPKHDGG